MPIPTNPVQVAADGHFRTSEISYFSECAGPKSGPYIVAGKIWIVGNNPFPTGNTFIQIFRSDDLGQTFTEADAANHPVAHDRLAATAPPNDNEWRVYDSVLVGTTIYVLYVQIGSPASSDPGPLAIAPFDTTGNSGLGAWGALLTGGPTVEVEPQIFLQYDNEGNQLHVVYQTTTGGSPTAILAYTVSLVGVWAGPTTVQAYGAAQNQLLGIAGGFDGVTTYFTQVFYRAIVGGASVREFRHRSLSTGLVVGASQLLDTFTDVGGTVDLLLGSPMSASTLNGNLVMAVIWARSSGGASIFSVFRSYSGAPGSAPTWVPTDVVAPEIGAITKNYTAIGVGVGADGTIELVYSTNNFNYRARTFTGGVWSVETTILDITSGPDFNIALNQVSLLAGDTVSNFGYVFTYGLAGNSTTGADELVAAKLIYKLNVFFFPIGGVLGISCNSPEDGFVGIAYSHFVEAFGGTEPYAFTISAGALPDGLSIGLLTGEISGTPTVAGSFPFTVEVTDADLHTAQVECSIGITAQEVDIFCDDPPIGIVATFYVHDFPVEGGIPPYTFEIITGVLPPGLVLDLNTGEVSGTPTTAGGFPITIMVTDSLDASGAVDCTITIRKRCLLVEVG